jgi:hypothetical protein
MVNEGSQVTAHPFQNYPRIAEKICSYAKHSTNCRIVFFSSLHHRFHSPLQAMQINVAVFQSFNNHGRRKMLTTSEVNMCLATFRKQL